MKNLRHIIPILLIPLLVSCNGQNKNYSHVINKYFDVRLPKYEEVIRYDSHGGFHNDGVTCFGITFENNEFSKQIESNSKWKSTPLPLFIENALFGLKENEETTSYPYITKSNESEPLVEKLEFDYYSFVDKQGNISLDKVENYTSLNFALSVYDNETCSFYFCEFDS